MKTLIYTVFSLFSLPLFSQPSEDNLIAWYPFNGNADDLSLHGHNGGVFGATLTTDRFGKENAAYFFDGTDDYIFVNDHPDLRLGETSFTISVWVRPYGLFDTQSHAVLSKRSGQGNKGYLFQLIGTNHVMGLAAGAFNIVTSGGWDDPRLTSNVQLSMEAWHHVVYRFDKNSNQGRFTIDNQTDISDNMIPADPFTSSDLYIGKDKLTDGNLYPDIAPGYVGGYHFYGAIDDIRLYDRKLTDEEVAELFNESVSSTQEELSSVFVKLSPDPVSSFLKIKVVNANVQTLAVSDARGKLICRSGFSGELDCRNFASGVYFLSLIGKNGEVLKTEKFVKS